MGDKEILGVTKVASTLPSGNAFVSNDPRERRLCAGYYNASKIYTYCVKIFEFDLKSAILRFTKN